MRKPRSLLEWFTSGSPPQHPFRTRLLRSLDCPVSKVYLPFRWETTGPIDTRSLTDSLSSFSTKEVTGKRSTGNKSSARTVACFHGQRRWPCSETRRVGQGLLHGCRASTRRARKTFP